MSVSPWRLQRLASQLVREISDILRRELKDPRIGFATVTRAVVSKDGRHAKVFVSVLGKEKEKKLTFAALRHARGFVQGELARRLQLRQMPELRFVRDDSVDRTIQVSEILARLRRDRGEPGEEE